MIETVREVGPGLGIAPTCAVLGLPTATYYRRIVPKPPPEPRPSPPRKLAAPEPVDSELHIAAVAPLNTEDLH